MWIVFYILTENAWNCSFFLWHCCRLYRLVLFFTFFFKFVKILTFLITCYFLYWIIYTFVYNASFVFMMLRIKFLFYFHLKVLVLLCQLLPATYPLFLLIYIFFVVFWLCFEFVVFLFSSKLFFNPHTQGFFSFLYFYNCVLSVPLLTIISLNICHRQNLFLSKYTIDDNVTIDYLLNFISTPLCIIDDFILFFCCFLYLLIHCKSINFSSTFLSE